MVQFVVSVVVDPRRAVRGTKAVGRSVDKLQRKTSALGATLRKAFLFVGAALGIRQLTRFVDSFNTLSNRLRTVIDDQDELNDTLATLGRVANSTRQDLGSIVNLYQRGTIAAKELGASNEDLLVFVRRVGQALAVQGGGVQETTGALRQLSQTLTSGIVRGEEFNSILENAFPLAEAAARGIEKTGGSVARLRAFILKGQITSREFFEGFLKGSDLIQERFARTVPTIGQAFTVLGNNFTLFVGKIDKAFGASGAFSRGIISVSNSLGTLADVIIGMKTALDPVFDSFKASFEGIFGSLDDAQPTLRNFVTNVAVAFDFVVGVVRGTVLAIADLFADFGSVLVLAQTIALRFGNTVTLAFQEIANGITSAFQDPIGFILRGLNTIVSAAAGAAATAAALGIISEDARVEIEDVASLINVTLDDLGARKPAPLPLFDTADVKESIADLDAEITLGFGALGAKVADSFQEGFGQPTFAPLIDAIFAEAAEAEAGAKELGTKIKEAVEEGTEGSGTTLAAGFAQAFSDIKKEAEDFAAISFGAVNSFADNATEALTEFATTGRFVFKDFARSVVSDLARIAARLLVVQAITAAVGIFSSGGAGPGGGAGNIIGAGISAFGGGKAAGGPVQAGRSFLVGEKGPEILTMGNQNGNITPNNAVAQPTNVTVVNVTDPNEAIAAMGTDAGQELILNTISKNRDRVKQDVA